MLKKLCLLIPLVLLVCIASTANGAVNRWTGGANTTDWQNPNNWDTSTVPPRGDDAFCYVVAGKPTPHITSTMGSDPLSLLCLAGGTSDSGTNDGELYIDSGTIYIASAVRTSKSTFGARTAKVTMKGGTVNVTGINTETGQPIPGGGGTPPPMGQFSWAPNEATETVSATWTMTAGLVTAGGFTVNGGNTGSTSIFNLNGGTVEVRMLSTGYGGLTNGGFGLFIAEGYNVNRTDNNYRQGHTNGTLNIETGTLIAEGDCTQLIAKYSNPDYNDINHVDPDPCNVIIAYPNDSNATYNKYIVCDYDERNDGKTTVTASKSLLAKAYKPSPVHDSLFATPQSQTLSWSAGSGATSHDVYFGTATSPPFVQNQPGTTYAPAANPLVLGRTYYWKINERSSVGTAVGDIWKFAVTGRAKKPTPANGTASIETGANKRIVLSWAAGYGATAHDVYLGTSTTNWTRTGGWTSTSIPYNSTEMGATYYWKINEISAGPTTTEGFTWSFSTAKYRVIDSFEQYNLSPGTPLIDSVWDSGSNIGVDLSIDTSTPPESVATPKLGIYYSGLKAMELAYSAASGLAGSRTANLSTLTQGVSQNWSETAVKALGLHIRGLGNNDPLTTLYVQLQDSTGTSSNKLYYSNTGSPTNTDIPVLGEEYISWTIPMSAITTVDKTKIKYMTIGFDSGGSATRAGTLYVDDIRLYPSRCVHNYELSGKAGSALADITNDCIVNGQDLVLVSNDWLKTDSQPEPDGILNNFQFDVNDGWVTSDVNTSGFGNALKLDGINDWVNIDDMALPEFYNKTISLYVKTTGTATSNYIWMLFGTSNDWRANIKIRGMSGGSQYVMAQIGGGKGRSASPGNLWPPTVQYAIPDEFGVTQLSADTWHHIALTLSPPDGSDGVTGKLYIDGVLGNGNYDRITSTYSHYYDYMMGASVGALNNGLQAWAKVTIDDFRIYSTVLDSTDLAKLADKNNTTNPTATPEIWYKFDESGTATTAEQDGSIASAYDPVGYTETPRIDVSDAELYTAEAQGSRKVNFRDYSRLAGYWLTGSSNEWVYP